MESIEELGALCLSRLRDGRLSEGDLTALIAASARHARPAQELLYVQSATSAVDSEAIGMNAVSERIGEIPRDPGQWPYRSVRAAMLDGWRVIRFPDPALLLEPEKTCGLGCEFILER